MMVAEPGLPGAEGVARCEHLATFGAAVFLARLLAAKGKVDALAGDLAIGGRERLRQHQLAGKAQNVVDQARTRLGRIFLDRQHRREAAAARAGDFQRVEAEADALVGQVLAKVGVRRGQDDRTHLAIVDARQEFERFRHLARVRAVAGEHSCAVGLKPGQERGGRRFEVADGATVVVAATAKSALKPLRPAGLAARGPTDDRQELLVDEQPALGEPRVPLLADRLAERGIELAARSDGHPPPNDVVIQHEARVEHAPQEHFAHRLRMIELVRVLRLELHAADVQRAHDGAVAQPDGRVVDVPVERQSVPSASFPLHPLGWAGPLHQRLLKANSCCSPSACNCARGGSG